MQLEQLKISRGWAIILENNPEGVRSRRNRREMAHTTFNRISRENLTLYPYQIIARHEFSDHVVISDIYTTL